METIGHNIRTLRKRLDISASDLSRESGVSKGYLSQIESGEVKAPSVIVAYNLAKVLGVTVEEMVTGTFAPIQPRRKRTINVTDATFEKIERLLSEQDDELEEPDNSLDFMYLLEAPKGTGLVDDLLYSNDRPARVYGDPFTGKYVAEIGHEDVINWPGNYVKYKGHIFVVTHVEITTGKNKGAEITIKPV